MYFSWACLFKKRSWKAFNRKFQNSSFSCFRCWFSSCNKKHLSLIAIWLSITVIWACCSCFASVTESHEDDSDDGDSKHVCIIAVFLLVRLLYLHIHSLDYLFRFIQTLTMLTDLIDFIAVSSSITYYSSNLLLKLIFSHWCSHLKMTHLERLHFFITKQQQYQLHRTEQRL